MSALPEHLRSAAAARTEQAASKAHAAITKLATTNRPITFIAVSREAAVSTDFLYRHTDLRAQIERHRRKHAGRTPQLPGPDDPASASSAVRALSRKLDEERRAHRETVNQLRLALEVAHGENLELRRRLASYEPA